VRMGDFVNEHDRRECFDANPQHAGYQTDHGPVQFDLAIRGALKEIASPWDSVDVGAKNILIYAEKFLDRIFPINHSQKVYDEIYGESACLFSSLQDTLPRFVPTQLVDQGRDTL